MKLRELTPQKILSSCPPLPGCPAIFELDDKSYVLIGKLEDAKALGIDQRVAEGEVVMSIPKQIIDDMKS